MMVNNNNKKPQTHVDMELAFNEEYFDKADNLHFASASITPQVDFEIPEPLRNDPSLLVRSMTPLLEPETAIELVHSGALTPPSSAALLDAVMYFTENDPPEVRERAAPAPSIGKRINANGTPKHSGYETDEEADVIITPSTADKSTSDNNKDSATVVGKRPRAQEKGEELNSVRAEFPRKEVINSGQGNAELETGLLNASEMQSRKRIHEKESGVDAGNTISAAPTDEAEPPVYKHKKYTKLDHFTDKGYESGSPAASSNPAVEPAVEVTAEQSVATPQPNAPPAETESETFTDSENSSDSEDESSSSDDESDDEPAPKTVKFAEPSAPPKSPAPTKTPSAPEPKPKSILKSASKAILEPASEVEPAAPESKAAELESESKSTEVELAAESGSAPKAAAEVELEAKSVSKAETVATAESESQSKSEPKAKTESKPTESTSAVTYPKPNPDQRQQHIQKYMHVAATKTPKAVFKSSSAAGAGVRNRHKQPNAKFLNKHVVRRFAKKLSIGRLSSEVYSELTRIVEFFMAEVKRRVTLLVESGNRKTVEIRDIKSVLETIGLRVMSDNLVYDLNDGPLRKAKDGVTRMIHLIKSRKCKMQYISVLPFCRAWKNIPVRISNSNVAEQLRHRGQALLLLRDVTESYIGRLMESAYIVMLNSGRKTLMARDFKSMVEVKRLDNVNIYNDMFFSLYVE